MRLLIVLVLIIAAQALKAGGYTSSREASDIYQTPPDIIKQVREIVKR